jgi:hypothetical protein
MGSSNRDSEINSSTDSSEQDSEKNSSGNVTLREKSDIFYPEIDSSSNKTDSKINSLRKVNLRMKEGKTVISDNSSDQDSEINKVKGSYRFKSNSSKQSSEMNSPTNATFRVKEDKAISSLKDNPLPRISKRMLPEDKGPPPSEINSHKMGNSDQDSEINSSTISSDNSSKYKTDSLVQDSEINSPKNATSRVKAIGSLEDNPLPRISKRMLPEYKGPPSSEINSQKMGNSDQDSEINSSIISSDNR